MYIEEQSILEGSQLAITMQSRYVRIPYRPKKMGLSISIFIAQPSF
jgi:hypothetical protein